MSQERCHSLDRVQGKEQRNPFSPNEVYVAERIPGKLFTFGGPQRAISAPDTHFRHYVVANNSRSSECIFDDNNIEFLEDFELPKFVDLPAESSFDEVRCIMATPPRTIQPTASTEIDEVIQFDDLGKRTATHTCPSDVDTQYSQIHIDDIRKRITAVTAESTTGPPLCHYKMPALSKDPHVIPSPPKDPNNVVELVRRARAIARLKELEEKQAALEQPKSTMKIRSLEAKKKLTSKAPTPTKLKAVTSKYPTVSQSKTGQAAGKEKPKLKKYHPIPQKTDPKTSTGLPQATLPPPKIPTFENILERISAIRSRTNAAKSVFREKKRDRLAPRPQEESEELEEFEILEELYGAAKPHQCPTVPANISDLRKRINFLHQQFLQPPISILTGPMEKEELNKFEVLKQPHVASTSFKRPAPEPFATIDLQDRINTLKEQLFRSSTRRQSPVNELDSISRLSRYEDLQQSKDVMTTAAEIQTLLTPASLQYTSSPTAALQTNLQNIDNARYQKVDMPKLDTNSVGAIANAGFKTGADVSLDEITMPDFDKDISFDEFGIEDITSPDLCDLSTSGNDFSLKPNFIKEISMGEEDDDHKIEKVVKEKISEQPGLLTSVVYAVVDRLKNIFSTSKTADAQNLQEKTEVKLDSSLPNMFETSSTESDMLNSQRTQTVCEKPTAQKLVIHRSPFVIPPHPRDPKDYKAMIKRAQALQKKRIEEYAAVKDSASSLPKTALLTKKKILTQKKTDGKKPTKVYPPGEYSPSYAKAVARARHLMGLKNLSAVLNPERAAKIAKQKAEMEAKLAVIEALPPVERMKEKMRSIRRAMGDLPRPSIEALATLEAIHENFPKTEVKSRESKWQPARRLTLDQHMKPSEKRFSPPAPKMQNTKSSKRLSIMSPILEEPELKADLIQFSPLKPHEVRMRLCYLKDQAAKQTANALRVAEEKLMEIESSPSRLTADHRTPPISPIQLYSPSCPRVGKMRRDELITKSGTQGRSDIAAEVAGISAIGSGEVHSSARQVIKNTDKYKIDVSYNTQKVTGLSVEEDAALIDNLADIEPPDSLNTSDMPRDPYTPTSIEIKSRIRPKMDEICNYTLPDTQHSPFAASPEMIDFPQDLPDEYLLDVKMPEFGETAKNFASYSISISPFANDIRMYAWGEHPLTTIPIRVSKSTVSPLPSELGQHINYIPKTKPMKETICIPPHPKGPKDYSAMIKRAQAIQKLKKQQEITLSQQYLPKTDQAPMSRRVLLPLKDSKRARNKILVLKKPAPKHSPRKIVQKKLSDMECLTELPPISEKYREAVVRARLLHGLQNSTAAFNLALAAKMARKKSNDANKVTYDALPEVEKIKIRIEELSKHPSKKRPIELSADLLGTLAAIRANTCPSSPSPQVHSISDLARESQTLVTTYPLIRTPQELLHKAIKSYIPPEQVQSTSLQEEFENIGTQWEPEASLEEFEALEAESKKLFDFDTPKRCKRHCQRRLISNFSLPSQRMRTQPSRIVSLMKPFSARTHSQALIPIQAGYRQDQGMLDKLFRKTVTTPKFTFRPDAIPGAIRVYNDPMQEFRVPAEDVLETSQLMFETPPRNIKERFERLKDAQEKQMLPSEDAVENWASAVPTIIYSPIELISPSGAACRLFGRLSSPHLLSAENELIFKIDETPERVTHPVTQLKDLEDMPFDKLEYEVEPAFCDISFEKPLSPPPRTSDIIRRIKSKSKAVTPRSALSSPPMLKFPEELPNEELLDQSAPSFTQTPPRTHVTKYKSRVSLPMDWGDTRTETQITPRSFAVRLPTLTKKTQKATPSPHIGPKERLRQLMAARKIPRTPIVTPVRTLEIPNTLTTLSTSPGSEKQNKDAVQTTAQLTTELHPVEDLEDIQEPSYLDITTSTPLEQPRPSDNIERVRTQVKNRYRPEVPTGNLLELRTPPPLLPLPSEISGEELQDTSYPSLERTPQSPERSPTGSPVRSPDISIPQLFHPTPPSLPPLFSLRQWIPSPEGPFIIPAHPKDPEDYRTIVGRARKIQQLRNQNEADVQAVEVPDAQKLLKTDRDPISRWNASPPKSPRKRKRLLIKKHDEIIRSKTPDKTRKECLSEPPLQPEYEYVGKHVAVAKKLAGLKCRAAELNTTSGAKAIRLPEQEEDARLTTLNTPPRLPVKNYAELLSRIKKLREKRDLVQSPISRYERIQAEKINIPSNFDERKPSYEKIFYSPICFVSPPNTDAQTDSAETSNLHKLNLAAFENLNELERLSEIEQPSYVDTSKYQITNNQYLPLTPPQTPPHATSDIINRIRQQYYQNIEETSQERPMLIPVSLEFPKILPEEQLFELSAPSFAETPIKPQTPIMTPNISLPQYFNESPLINKSIIVFESTDPKKSSSQIPKSPSMHGICPEIKTRTPQGQMTIPSHSNNSKDVVAMIRRAQLIQKLLAKEAAVSQKGRKKKQHKGTTRSAIECSTETSYLPPEYPAAVSKARKLSGFQNVPAQLKSKAATKRRTTYAATPTSAAAKVTPPPPTYETIVEKFAALRAKHKKPNPSARELTHKQHLTNRQQRQDRKILLNELEQLRRQQDLNWQPLKNLTPAEERLKAIKSRIAAEATTSSGYPYSPVKTPAAVDLPQFQPLSLPLTPPYPFLENVSIADIADVSMQLDDVDNFNLDHETIDENDLEFELAEIANAAYDFDEHIDVVELDRAKDNFNIAERIKELQQDLLKSSDEINAHTFLGGE